jgi:chitin-binding protein
MRIASLCFALVIAGCASSSKAPGTNTEEPTDEPDAAETTPTPKKDAASSTSTGGSPATGGAGGGGGTTTETPDAAAGGTGGSAAPDAAPSASDAPPSTGGPMIPGCTLRWSPSAMRDGEKAFEAVEMPDVQFPGGSPGTHRGVKHITAIAEHDAYRIDSHYDPPNAVDYDRVTQTGPMRDDRLRCETRGMVDGAGKQVEQHNGETWRFTWSLYIPASLKGTSRFTHIYQMKYLDKNGGASGSPIVTVTLRSGDKMEVLFWIGGGSITTFDISALHDKWLSADLTMKIATAGNVHWVLKDGEKVIVDKTQNGTTWPSDGDRLRPKWGIYRGITTGVQTSYIMLSDLRAYQCQ